LPQDDLDDDYSSLADRPPELQRILAGGPLYMGSRHAFPAERAAYLRRRGPLPSLPSLARLSTGSADVKVRCA